MNFFISYTKVDLAWAEWVAWQLEASGYTTVVQAWDFRPGGNFVLEMERVLLDAEQTIAVLSPSYLQATYTHPGWAHAFARDPQGQQHLLLPVRVIECRPRGLLAQVIYIDLVGLNEEAAKSRLLAQVRRERGKPQLKPSFPAAGVIPKPNFPIVTSDARSVKGADPRPNKAAAPPTSLRAELQSLLEIDRQMLSNKEDTITASARLREWKKRVATLTGSGEVYNIEADDDRKGKGMYGVLRNVIKKCRLYIEYKISEAGI